jgi:mycofactocin precursor
MAVAPTEQPQDIEPSSEDEELVTEDLIEEISIDGMCGVY